MQMPPVLKCPITLLFLVNAASNITQVATYKLVIL
jgi:hypothetical protein